MTTSFGSSHDSEASPLPTSFGILGVQQDREIFGVGTRGLGRITTLCVWSDIMSQNSIHIHTCIRIEQKLYAPRPWYHGTLTTGWMGSTMYILELVQTPQILVFSRQIRWQPPLVPQPPVPAPEFSLPRSTPWIPRGIRHWWHHRSPWVVKISNPSGRGSTSLK